MVSTSGKLAVKRRALRAATWLDLCAGHLLGELEKQTVELYQRHGVLPGGSIDHDLIPITFERRDVEEADPRNARVLGRASTVREMTDQHTHSHSSGFSTAHHSMATGRW